MSGVSGVGVGSLSGFLHDRINEDEQGARVLLNRDVETGVRAEWLGFLPGRGSFAERMLAECEAKRRIADWHPLVSGTGSDGAPVVGCANCICRDDDRTFTVAGPCLTLRLLALPYAGHPEYQEAWRP